MLDVLRQIADAMLCLLAMHTHTRIRENGGVLFTCRRRTDRKEKMGVAKKSQAQATRLSLFTSFSSGYYLGIYIGLYTGIGFEISQNGI